MVKSNIQNKSSTTNVYPSGPQATPTSVGESLDSLNLISHASSRTGKYIYSREHSCACCTVRCSFRSVSAVEDFRKASLELSFSFEEKKSNKKEVSLGPRTSTVSRIITDKLSHRIALLQLSYYSLSLLLKGEHILWVEMTKFLLRKVEALPLEWFLASSFFVN